MKIKHSFVLHTTVLLALLSTAIIVATLNLSNKSREMVLLEMHARFHQLQVLTLDQFERAKDLASEGVSEASNLTAINRIIQTTNDSQANFLSLVNAEMDKANTAVEQILADQVQLAMASLESLKISSVDSITSILDAGRKASRLLADVAISNIESLKSASLESIKRLEQERQLFTEDVAGQQRQMNAVIDGITADLLLASLDPAMTSAAFQNMVLERMSTLKEAVGSTQQQLYAGLIHRTDLQQKVLAEEIRLSVKKIEWAVDREERFTARLHGQQSREVLQQLDLAHGRIQRGIEESSAKVNLTLEGLQATLGGKLTEVGRQTSAELAENAAATRKEAEAVKSRVSQRITDNSRTAQQLFEGAVDQSRQVVEQSLLASRGRTVAAASAITFGCVALGLVLSLMLARNMTGPIARVVDFARQLAQGNRARRLPEGNDEMGMMGRALNAMSDELQRLETAMVDSFVQTLDQVLDCVFMLDPDTFRFTYANKGAIDHLGHERERILTMTPLDINQELTLQSLRDLLLPLKEDPSQSRFLTTVHTNSRGEEIPVEVLIRFVRPPGNDPRYIVIVRDITEKVRERQEKEAMQADLLHRQKLESVGQLAAGIAHEINTPTQYIGTNIDFLGEACQEMADFVRQLREKARQWPEDARQQLEELLDDLDWAYLEEEMPQAIAQSRDGVKRVSSLVMAMKRFSHPGSRELSPASLNEVIETAVTVSRNEWKYVAEVKTALAEKLPDVPLLVDEMGQVLLNLIINSAHAIKDRQEAEGCHDKGLITIATSLRDAFVELRFTDTGIGIPKSIIAKVFDPFFTTKEVGKGTGQGLAISRDVVVNKHGGRITVQSEEGVGTTFTILLPLVSREE